MWLYEFAPTRSIRVRWTLQELGVDLVAAYTLDWANEVQLLDNFPQLLGYMERMYARPNAPLHIAEAIASIR